jgi:hypothetical protein
LKFVNGNSRAISLLEGDQLKLFEFFYNSKNTPSQLVKSLVGKKLMLTAWPDFTVVIPTPGIIELGAKLTREPWPYNDLVKTSELGDESKLNKALVTFHALGILKVIKENPSKDSTSVVREARPSGFYVKMKAFLGFGK